MIEWMKQADVRVLLFCIWLNTLMLIAITAVGFVELVK